MNPSPDMHNNCIALLKIVSNIFCIDEFCLTLRLPNGGGYTILSAIVIKIPVLFSALHPRCYPLKHYSYSVNNNAGGARLFAII